MEKFLLNGKWRIQSNTYDTVGDVPGSVYSALLVSGLMEDPFYRDNERKALDIMDEEFVFTKEFEYKKKSDKILLVCEGIDTLCDLYINGNFVAHTNNMHRTYVFDVAQYLLDGKNVIKAKKSIEEDLHRRNMPEVEYFFEHFAPSFELSLDELEGF